MQHIFLLSYLILILIGVISVTIAAVTYYRTRNKLLIRYVLYISNFTIFIFFDLFIILYLNLNMAAVNFFFLVIMVAIALTSWALLVYTVPRFTHSLIWEDYPRERDLIFGILAIFTLLLMFLSFRITLHERELYQEKNIWFYISMSLFHMMVIYSIALKVIHLRRLSGERRKIVKNIILLDALVFPGVIIDLFLYIRLQIFAFTPIFYCMFSILFTRYILRQYFAKLSTISSGLEETVIGSIMDRSGISPREKEIVMLLMNGLGNREIAEKLFISLNTVKTHNRNIFQKMGVKSRFELLVKLQECDFGES
jgi:DNA-binding CsgD family transcriptional regulator